MFDSLKINLICIPSRFNFFAKIIVNLKFFIPTLLFLDLFSNFWIQPYFFHTHMNFVLLNTKQEC